MRQRHSNRRRKGRRLMQKLAFFAACIAILTTIGSALPSVGKMVSHAAILSASLTLPEGGVALLNREKNQEDPTDPSTLETVDPAPAPQENTPSSANTSIDIGISQEEIDSYNQHDGAIIRKTYTPGASEDYIQIANNAYVRNMTKLPNQTAIDAIQSRPSFTLRKGKEPQVLIVHTHTTESYQLAARDFYDKRNNPRSREQSRNVVRVGDAITQKLEQAGIGVIHSNAEHDYPSYNGAYDRSRATIQSILQQHPSIQVILDIHRDAISDDQGNYYAPVANVHGKDAAQVMIISGCDDGTMNYPNYLQNLSFASLLEQQIEADHPGLTRPVSFKYKFYNQDLTTGSLLIEVGAFGNSLEEAVYSGQLIGESLGKGLAQITE